MTARRDRHWTLAKCLHMASPTAKLSAAESQEWAINNATDFHLAAKLSSWKTGNPFGHSSHLEKKKAFALVQWNWNDLQERCDAQWNPGHRPFICILALWKDDIWGMCSFITVLSQLLLLPFGRGDSQKEGCGSFCACSEETIFWAKIHFYFSASC